MSKLVGEDFEPINGYKPTLPDDDVIVMKCRDAYQADLMANIRGVVVDNAAGQHFWVKFGTCTSVAEARTQHYVARAVSSQGDAPVRVPAVYRYFESKLRRYIVMEFVDGRVCTGADVKDVAAAVSFLITIPAPANQRGPGPVGGGPIGHHFFIDWISSVTYPTVELLSKHINGILKHVKRTKRVDLGPEVETHGLRLCLSDMNHENFMRDGQGKIVAIDFDASCFLPISFFEMALHHHDPFTRLIRRYVVRPDSTQAEALLLASDSLVMYQVNNVGLPAELKRSRK